MSTHTTHQLFGLWYLVHSKKTRERILIFSERNPFSVNDLTPTPSPAVARFSQRGLTERGALADKEIPSLGFLCADRGELRGSAEELHWKSV